MLLSLKYNHILFITASRIGDAVLSTGVLAELHRRYPTASFTIVCGALTASLFEGAPNVRQVIPLVKQRHNKHWLSLWLNIVGQKFDIVVDFRNSAVSRALGAREKYIYGKHVDKSVHKVVQAAQICQMNPTPSPQLWFTPAQNAVADSVMRPDETVIAIGPAANWAGKTWPAARFIDVARWLIRDDGHFPHAKVAVFAAPREEDVAYRVFDSLPEGRRINGIAQYDPATAAAIVARCDLYLGNDSGLMHCAAAAGVQTVGVFGPSYPHLYRPWGDHTTYVATPESFDELIDFDGYDSKTVGTLMNSLSVDAVKAEMTAFFNKGIKKAV